MRFMDLIRQKGKTGLTIFLVIFVISIFAGLGVSSFFGGGRRRVDQQNADSQRTRVVSEGEMASAILRVNGRVVDDMRFFYIFNMYFRNMQQQLTDDSLLLNIYGMTAEYFVSQEVMLDEAEKMNISVTRQELNEKKDEIIAQYLDTSDKQSGNAVGELARKLGSTRERRIAWEQFLTNSGKTEQSWVEETKRSIKLEKVRDAFQEAADAEMEREALEKKALVDKELAEGASFEDLARKYSDGDNAVNGGDIGTIGRGFVFAQESEDALFSTPVGEISDWIEVEGGWQRFEVYEKIEAEGEEFEAARDETIARIRTDKGDQNYEPTDEEIVNAYEKVMARQIQLNAQDMGASHRRVQELVEQAEVEMNDNMILAFQALMKDGIQPPAGIGYEDLKQIASNAATGEGYDFEMIRRKLENGKPKAAGAAGEDEPATDAAETEPAVEEPAGESLADGADAAQETGAEDTAADAGDGTDVEGGQFSGMFDDEEAAPEEDDADEPVGAIYALAIGLLMKEIQDQEDEAINGTTYYIIGKLYMDWLKYEDTLKGQPIDRDKAREEIERHFEIAAKSIEYKAELPAYRALNLLWMGEEEKARELLINAEKYAPNQQGGIWDVIRECYEKLEDDDKLAEIDAKMAEIQSAALQAQIEAMQRQPGGQAASIPITVGGDEGEAADTDGSEAPAGEPGDEAPATEPEDAETPSGDGSGAEPEPAPEETAGE